MLYCTLHLLAAGSVRKRIIATIREKKTLQEGVFFYLFFLILSLHYMNKVEISRAKSTLQKSLNFLSKVEISFIKSTRIKWKFCE